MSMTYCVLGHDRGGRGGMRFVFPRMYIHIFSSFWILEKVGIVKLASHYLVKPLNLAPHL